MEITLYVNNSDKKVVDKSITLVDTLTNCNIKEDTDLSEPTIIISNRAVNFNYVYIPYLARYYFVLGSSLNKGGLLEVRLKCDTLKSFYTYYSQNQAILARHEYNVNMYLNDSEFIASQKTVTSNYSFSAGFSNEMKYILTTCGIGGI